MLGRQNASLEGQRREALLDEVSAPKLRFHVRGDALWISSYLSPIPTLFPLFRVTQAAPPLAAGKEAVSIIHLNVSIKQGYDQDETRNKVF